MELTHGSWSVDTVHGVETWCMEWRHGAWCDVCRTWNMDIKGHGTRT